MAKLQLSVAVGDYDRVRPLIDGAVAIDGVDPTFMTLVPEEIFFRAFRHAEFDICELSMSSFTVKTAQGDNPYVGVPAFLSRAFRHTSIYVRTDRVRAPADLKGRKIGVPEYQLTANVWARAILEDDHGVKPADVTWVRGGIETPGRPEKISIDLPKEIKIESAPDGSLKKTPVMVDAATITPMSSGMAPRSAAKMGRPRASSSAAVISTIGTLRIAPTEARIAFGPYASAQPGNRTTPPASNAAPSRTIVPTLPGSCTPSSATTILPVKTSSAVQWGRLKSATAFVSVIDFRSLGENSGVAIGFHPAAIASSMAFGPSITISSPCSRIAPRTRLNHAFSLLVIIRYTPR